MRILLTNDDGIHAPGLQAARAALSALGEVFTIAPERPRSAAGHSITLHKPLRLERLRLPDGTVGTACSGTPTDCVTLGFDVILEQRCDLVVSGINAGANLGWDLTYSGTVSAAIEGAVLGLPAIAVSLVIPRPPSDPLDYRAAADFTARLAAWLQAEPLPAGTLLNVNVPHAASETAQAELTHQGRREYVDRIETRADPSGRPYYWLAGSIREDVPDPGSDVHAVLQGRISITPLHLDMTAYPLLERLRLRPPV